MFGRQDFIAAWGFANKFCQTERNNKTGIKFHKEGTQAKCVNLISSLMFRVDCVEVYQRDALKSALTFSFQEEWKHFILPFAIHPLLSCSMLHFSSDINFNLSSFFSEDKQRLCRLRWILVFRVSCVWENAFSLQIERTWEYMKTEHSYINPIWHQK